MSNYIAPDRLGAVFGKTHAVGIGHHLIGQDHSHPKLLSHACQLSQKPVPAESKGTSRTAHVKGPDDRPRLRQVQHNVQPSSGLTNSNCRAVTSNLAKHTTPLHGHHTKLTELVASVFLTAPLVHSSPFERGPWRCRSPVGRTFAKPSNRMRPQKKTGESKNAGAQPPAKFEMNRDGTQQSARRTCPPPSLLMPSSRDPSAAQSYVP